MKVAIWDTNVLREDGKIMHFNILAPKELKDVSIIYKYGDSYVKTKSFKTKKLIVDECTFCNLENLKKETREYLLNKIDTEGYAIVELQYCD